MKKSREVETIRTIIWDLDKTFWSYHDEQLKIYCNKLGIEETPVLEEQFYTMLNKFDLFFKNRKVNYFDLIYFIEIMMPELGKLGIPATEFLKLQYEADVAVLNEEARDILALMQNAGKKNIVLTDWIGIVQIKLLKRFELLEYIEQVFTVDGRFLKAHKNSKKGIVIPGREDGYIIIGDSLDKDIRFAQNAGIKSVWYNPNKLRNETKYEPTFEVTSLLEIASFIK